MKSRRSPILKKERKMVHAPRPDGDESWKTVRSFYQYSNCKNSKTYIEIKVVAMVLYFFLAAYILEDSQPDQAKRQTFRGASERQESQYSKLKRK